MQLHNIAQPQLPDLSGLPQWVQITVVLLLAVGWVSAQWARRRPAEVEDEEDASETRPLPPGGVPSGPTTHHDPQSAAVILRALDLLHAEAEESRGERGEAERWRKRAAELEQALDDCNEQLQQPDGRHER